MLLKLLSAAAPSLKITALQISSTIPLPGPGRQETGLARLEVRPGGMIEWMKRLFGGGSTTSLQVTSHRVVRVDHTKTQEDTLIIPLLRIASISYGHYRAVFKLPLGAMICLAAIAGVFVTPAAIALLLPGAGLIAWHFLSGPTFSLWLTNVNGQSLSIKVKAKEELERLQQFAELIPGLIRANEAAGNTNITSQTSVPPQVPARA